MENDSFSAWPYYDDEQINAVAEVLRSGKVNAWTGHHCNSFEDEFAEWVGTRYAVALANGTVALELALKSLGISAGDEVIVTPRTFIASVSCIVSVGAKPVFADIDRDSQNITADTVARVCTEKTRAIICVHLAGWPVEMDSIREFAEPRNIYLVEDCAQAHGAVYRGRSVGTFADVSAWSFCQDKIITTGGEGGMITTNNRDVRNYIRSYKDHGKSWDAVYSDIDRGQGFKWVHDTFGTNSRMTEIQAVLGRIQLARMPQWHNRRARNAGRILETARKFPVFRVPRVPDDIGHAWYKCYFFVDNQQLAAGWSRDRIVNEIHALGVPCYTGSCSEVYLEKAFDNSGFRPERRLQVASELGDTSIMMLVHPTLDDSAMDEACSVLEQIARQAIKQV